MKKFIAMLLALVMVCGLATVAFAATTDAAGNFVDESTITITKWYNNPNNGVSPAETLKFEIKFNGVEHAGVEYDAETQALPTVAAISFAEGDAGKVIFADGVLTYNCKRDIVVTLPQYNAVGIYTYTINEIPGSMAGVTYYTDDITLKVTVIEQDGKIRVAAVHTESKGEEKKDTFENVYESGSLTVNKQVTGNLGDMEKDFTVTVTFTAPAGETVGAPISYTDDGESKTVAAGWTGTTSATIDLKHDETITFTNIPEGVTYTVVEADYTGEDYAEAVYAFSDEAKKVDTAVDGENIDSVVITNNKEAEVDTGVVLDSMPYVLILAVAMGGLVLFTAKKRVQD